MLLATYWYHFTGLSSQRLCLFRSLASCLNCKLSMQWNGNRKLSSNSRISGQMLFHLPHSSWKIVHVMQHVFILFSNSASKLCYCSFSARVFVVFLRRSVFALLTAFLPRAKNVCTVGLEDLKSQVEYSLFGSLVSARFALTKGRGGCKLRRPFLFPFESGE